MTKPVKNTIKFCGFLLAICVFPLLTGATEFTSQNFKVIDPVISVGGGRSTSASFQTEQSVGQPALGISTSASFQLKGGFLYFAAPAAAAAEAAPAAEVAAAAGGGSLLPILLPVAELFLPPAEIPKGCQPGFSVADFNCDGRVGLKDLSAFLFLSAIPTPNPADLNHDAVVNTRDLSILFTQWNERLLSFVPEEQLGVFGPGREVRRPPRQFAAAAGAAPSAVSAPAGAGPSGIQGFLQKISGVLKKIIDIPRLVYQGATRYLNPLFRR